jgi:hypothetical protein
VPPLTRRLAPLAVLAALAVPLAGCGTSAPSNTPVRAGVNGSLSDIQNKIDLIAQDDCAIKPAASVFPNCPRFIAEVSNAAIAAKGAAPGRPGAAQLEAAATALGDAASAFTGDGCVASPSQVPPSAATCGPDLEKIQSALRTLRSAVARSAVTPATPTPTP